MNTYYSTNTRVISQKLQVDNCLSAHWLQLTIKKKDTENRPTDLGRV
jgi:hypothetical protein